MFKKILTFIIGGALLPVMAFAVDTSICSSKRIVDVRLAFKGCDADFLRSSPIFIEDGTNTISMKLCASEKRFQNLPLQRANDWLEAIHSQLLFPARGWQNGYLNARGHYTFYNVNQLKTFACAYENILNELSKAKDHTLLPTELEEKMQTHTWVTTGMQLMRYGAEPAISSSNAVGAAHKYTPYYNFNTEAGVGTPLYDFFGRDFYGDVKLTSVADLDAWSQFLTQLAQAKQAAQDDAALGMALGFRSHVLLLNPEQTDIAGQGIGGPDWSDTFYNMHKLWGMLVNAGEDSEYAGPLSAYGRSANADIDAMLAKGTVDKATADDYKQQHAAIYNQQVLPQLHNMMQEFAPGSEYFLAARHSEFDAGLRNIHRVDANIGTNVYKAIVASRTTYLPQDGVFCIRKTDPEQTWQPGHDPYQFYKAPADADFLTTLQTCGEQFAGWFREQQLYWKTQYEQEVGQEFTNLEAVYADIEQRVRPQQGIHYLCTEHYKQADGSEFASEQDCNAKHGVLKTAADDVRFAPGGIDSCKDGTRLSRDICPLGSTKLYRSIFNHIERQLLVFRQQIGPKIFSQTVLNKVNAPVLQLTDPVYPVKNPAPGALINGLELRGGTHGSANVEVDRISRISTYNFDTQNPDSETYFFDGIDAVMVHEMGAGHTVQVPIAEDEAEKNVKRWGYTRTDRSGRNTFESGFYVEGWASYIEILGLMEGFFNKIDQQGQLTDIPDPTSHLINLRNSARIAARLIIDPAVNVNGMGLNQAIATFNDITSNSARANAVNLAVARTIHMPGQILGYGTGALAMLGLKARAEQACGKRFSLPAFHDRLLLGDVNGNPTVGVMERVIDGWIGQGCPA